MVPPASDAPAPPAADRLHGSRAVRVVLWIAGALALLLGLIGVVLPGLPTTPFVLLAGACFVRASPRSHAWLLRSRLFGPLLREWEQHRSIPRRVKRLALAAMIVTGGFSVWHLAGQPWLQATVLVAMGAGSAMVLRIRSRD